jgi:hypothetical protein
MKCGQPIIAETETDLYRAPTQTRHPWVLDWKLTFYRSPQHLPTPRSQARRPMSSPYEQICANIHRNLLATSLTT